MFECHSTTKRQPQVLKLIVIIREIMSAVKEGIIQRTFNDCLEGFLHRLAKPMDSVKINREITEEHIQDG